MNISWCTTTSKKDKEGLKETINSINNQTIKPFETLVTEGGNISQGINKLIGVYNDFQ